MRSSTPEAGSRRARATGEQYVANVLGDGFLRPGAAVHLGRQMRTTDDVDGVVFSRDVRERSYAWNLRGEKKVLRRSRRGRVRTDIEIYKVFYPDTDLAQLGAGGRPDRCARLAERSRGQLAPRCWASDASCSVSTSFQPLRDGSVGNAVLAFENGSESARLRPAGVGAMSGLRTAAIERGTADDADPHRTSSTGLRGVAVGSRRPFEDQ